jgi:hypothetical protein
MPPVGRGWTERQVNALYEYMTTTPALRGGGENGG